MSRRRTSDHPALRELDHLYTLANRLNGGDGPEAEKLVLTAVRDTLMDDGVPTTRELETALVRAFLSLARPSSPLPDSRELDPDVLDRLPPEVVRDVLDGLPAELRVSLALTVQAEMDEDTAAEALSLTAREVSERAHHGRLELRRRLVACAKAMGVVDGRER